MQKHVGKWIVTTLCLVSVVSGLVFEASSARAKDSPSLEALLKEAQVEYTRTDKGVFKIMVENKGDAVLVLATETSIGDSPDLKLVYLFTTVLSVPEGFKHPPAMLKKMATLNGNMVVGKVGIDESGDVYYTSSFWLRTADATTVNAELALAFVTRQTVKKELDPFVKE